jgi:hypothetical protein
MHFQRQDQRLPVDVQCLPNSVVVVVVVVLGARCILAGERKGVKRPRHALSTQEPPWGISHGDIAPCEAVVGASWLI